MKLNLPVRARRHIRVGLMLTVVGFIFLNLAAALHAHRLTRFGDYPADRPVPEKMSCWDRLTFVVAGGYAPKSRLKAQPEFDYQSIRFNSSGNTTLQAWKSTAPSSTTATVILCHGHGATRSALLREASFFHNLGFRVFLFDFRAHGESSGDVCSVGYYEADDVRAAWDHVRSAHPDNEVIVYGISMGAVAAARAVSEYDLQPAALILEMPFNRLIDAVRARVRLMKFPVEPAATLLTFWGGVQLGFSGFELETASYIRETRTPILLQWGTADHRVSKDEILAIKSAAHPNLLHFETYPGFGHTSLAKKAHGQWTKNVHTWLSKTLN